MNDVKVLIEGYAQEEGETIVASSTTTLIYSNNLKILVDPGANSKLLLHALSRESLTPNDIDIVFITHYHPDHVLNIRLFPNHKIYDGDTIYDDDKESFYSEKIPETDIEVISVPGHAHELAALKVVAKEYGNIVITGDVFWWMDGEQNVESYESLIGHEDPYVKDLESLIESRKKILEISDWIIPGHGKMFQNKFKRV